MEVNFQIWTFKTELPEKMQDRFFKGATVALVFFDLNNLNSFKALDSWLSELQAKQLDLKYLAIIGHKADLEINVKNSEIDTYISKWKIKFPVYINYFSVSSITPEIGDILHNDLFQKISKTYIESLSSEEKSVEQIFAKLILIGGDDIGKSTFRRRLLGEGFTQDHLMTLGADFAIKRIQVDSDLVQVENNETQIIEAEVPKDENDTVVPSESEITNPDDFTKSIKIEPPTEVTKNISIEHFDRMISNKYYLLKINISSDSIETVKTSTKLTTGERSVQIKSDLTIDAGKDSKVIIEPFYPGCIVVPQRHIVDFSDKEAEVKFFITPLVFGQIEDSSIKFSNNNQIVLSINTPSKVINPRTSQLIAIGGSLVALTPKIMYFGLGINNPAVLLLGTSMDLLFLMSIPGIFVSLISAYIYRRKNRPRNSIIRHKGREFKGIITG